MDLSGQVLHIVLNPAAADTVYNDATGILTFTDVVGNTHNVVCPKPVQHGTSGWWTCFPQACMPLFNLWKKIFSLGSKQ